MTTAEKNMESIIEAALFSAGEPLTIERILLLFDPNEVPAKTKADIKAVLDNLEKKYQPSGIELKKVASGYRFQAKADYAEEIQRLFENRPPRYSRALLETLAIIAYKQPVTRAEIEDIRGVTTSGHLIKLLLEREWLKIVGYKDVPGKPALYGTTQQFLDYFNLEKLSHLPALNELIDMEKLEKTVDQQLGFHIADEASTPSPLHMDISSSEISTEAAEEIDESEWQQTIQSELERADAIMQAHLKALEEKAESEEAEIITQSESTEIE